MNKFRKALLLLFAVLTLVSMSLFAAACNACDDGKENGENFKPSITLNYDARELSIFESFVLRVKNSDAQITWKSSDDGVVSVDNKGRVTANGFGTATITASDGKNNGECLVTVTDDGTVPELKLNLAENKLSIIKTADSADKFQLKAYVLFNDKQYDDAKPQFKSSAADVATVDENGLITAVGYGKAEITIGCSWRIFDKKYTTETVIVNVCHDVSVDLAAEESVIYMETAVINGVSYSNNTSIIQTVKVDGKTSTDSYNASFTSSDESVLTVDADGDVTGKAFGKASVVMSVIVDGERYESLPIEIEVSRPKINENKIFNVSNGANLELPVGGDAIAVSLNGNDCLDKVSNNGGICSFSLDNVKDLRGESRIHVETKTRIYDYDVMFITHTIESFEQLKTYLKEYTNESSADDYVIITADIDCGGYKFTGSNRWFCGHINGMGHAIKNYDADEYGLIGGRLVGGPIIENVALFFSASGANGVALANRLWTKDSKMTYLNNVYINVVSSTAINGVICGGTENQDFTLNNVIIDVSSANVEYAFNASPRGNMSVIKECYALGAPSSGEIVKKVRENEYTGVLCASQSEMYATYAKNINKDKGFNEYWSVKEDGIYFGETRIVNRLPLTVLDTVYQEQTYSLNLSRYVDGDTVSVSVNGGNVERFETASVPFKDYKVGSYNVIEIIGKDKVTRIPFIPVTVIINSGEQFLHVLRDYYGENNKESEGDYVILGQDIVLPQSGSTSGEWSTNNWWHFRRAHFNGCGYSIDCKNVKFVGDGIFGDVRFSTIENVAIINASAKSGCPIIASNAWGGAVVSNVYAECNYLGGNSVGLLLTGEANVKNCVVSLTNVSDSGTNYALSTGCKTKVSNCFAIGSANKATNLDDNDDTRVFADKAEFFLNATEAFTADNGFSEFWQVKNDGLYFGNKSVIKK